MTAETLAKWAAFLATHSSVLLYTVDPGAHAIGHELSTLLVSCGRLQGWYAEGWSLMRRPECRTATELPANLHRGTTLLLGSQTNFSQTHHFLQQARGSGARSIFVFDHWKNYAEHFRPGLLADQIVVPDDVGKKALLEAIGPAFADCIFILPHPGIDASVNRIHACPLRLPGTIAVLLDPTEAADGLGYDWRSVLQEVALRAAVSPAVSFLIKPHPRQHIDTVQAFVAGLGFGPDRLRLVDMDTEQLIAAADEVWGMTTIALVSAFKAGKPIKSIQLGRNDRGRAASNHYLEPYLI